MSFTTSNLSALAGQTATLTITNDTNNQVLVDNVDVFAGDAPCYCRGTLILTTRGEVPVEDLAIGDSVATRGGLRLWP